MKFKFEYLQPKTEAVQIIECYETLGYTPCFNTVGFSEVAQWSDNTDIITMYLTHHENDTLTLHLPKLWFEKRIKYKDWMPREDFEKLCKQDKSYSCAECVLAVDMNNFGSLAKNSKSMVCTNPYVLRIGRFGVDNQWWSYGDLADMSRYKYVKLIKYDQE